MVSAVVGLSCQLIDHDGSYAEKHAEGEDTQQKWTFIILQWKGS